MFGVSFGCELGPGEPSSMVEKYREFDGNLILILWDGVRWQEFKGAGDRKIAAAYDQEPEFDASEFEKKVLTRFWSAHGKKGLVFGLDPYEDRLMETLNHFNSTYPSMRSIFLGKPVLCTRGDCPRVSEPTFLERIKRKRGFETKKVAAFSHVTDDFSLSIEKEAGSVHSETSNPADGNTDRETFGLAMDYLDTEPRVMVIYLSLTDYCGHIEDYRCYIDTMKDYDDYLDRLFRKLETMGEYGEKTVLVVTTDHGRGASPDRFHDHVRILEAKNVWMYIAGPFIRTSPESNGVVDTDHLIDHGIIRPLAETIMGIAPLYPGVRYTEFMDSLIFEE
ncbi:MAG: sulfatase-like hydrolase/transferase [Proteobacteria bacterium]|nr:sulfatase-like hydrolase/transferase [Pseudomonadota bacterium]